jgi:hypothetical protein
MHDSYFFERSAAGFDPIYRYYASGVLHKPRDVCAEDFLDELRFWEIPIQVCVPVTSRQILLGTVAVLHGRDRTTSGEHTACVAHAVHTFGRYCLRWSVLR